MKMDKIKIKEVSLVLILFFILPIGISVVTNQYINYKLEGNKSCGNNICERNEFLFNCKSDCEGLKRHEYKICLDANNEPSRMSTSIIGANIIIKPSEELGPDLVPNENCGRGDNPPLSECYYCYTINEVNEPTFHFNIDYESMFNRVDVCEDVVAKYFIDNIQQNCSNSKSLRQDDDFYYPYYKETFDKLRKDKT